MENKFSLRHKGASELFRFGTNNKGHFCQLLTFKSVRERHRYDTVINPRHTVYICFPKCQRSIFSRHRVMRSTKPQQKLIQLWKRKSQFQTESQHRRCCSASQQLFDFDNTMFHSEAAVPQKTRFAFPPPRVCYVLKETTMWQVIEGAPAFR